MENRERQARLMTAARFLAVLKQNGLPARSAAKFLGLSTTTISYWSTVTEGEVRGAGVPTDEHLVKLVALLRYQIEQNHGAIHGILHDPNIREIEKILLLKSMLPQVAASTEHFREDMNDWVSFANDLRALVDKYGSQNTDATLVTIPDSDDEADADLPFGAPGVHGGLPLGLMMMNSGDFLRRFDGADSEMEQAKASLGAHFVERHQRAIIEAGERATTAQSIADSAGCTSDQEGS